MLKAILSWYKSATRNERRRRPQSESAQLRFDLLETRVMPIVGSVNPAPVVSPGSNLDGVVQIVGRGTGAELANQTQILTAAHIIWGTAQNTVLFNLQRDGNGVPIFITIPPNRGGGAAPNYFFDGYNGNVPGTNAPGLNDIAVMTLRDTLPLLFNQPGNDIRLIAPFSPFESGYQVVPLPAAPPIGLANTNGPRVTVVGYGTQGTGALGIGLAVPPPFAQLTIGQNTIDQTLPAAGAGSAPDVWPAGSANFFQMDFDGAQGNGVFGGPSLGSNNTTPGGQPAHWLDEVSTAFGDSGGPVLIGTVGDGENLAGASAEPLQIVAVNSWIDDGNAHYGTHMGATVASAFNQPGGLLQNAQNDQYGVVLDMRYQVLGVHPLQHPLTITVGRGTPAGIFQADGPNLLIQVTDTAGFADYDGIYFNQPVNNALGQPWLTQGVTLVGNWASNIFQIRGNLGVGPIFIQGQSGINPTSGEAIVNEIQFLDQTNTADTAYEVTGGSSPGGGARLRTTIGGVTAQEISAANFARFSIVTGSGANTVNIPSVLPQTTLTVSMGTANSTATIGTLVNGLTRIGGQVNLSGTALSLTVNDQGGPAGSTYTNSSLTPGTGFLQVDRPGMLNANTIRYLATSLTVNESSPFNTTQALRNITNIDGTAANTTINCGVGPNIVRVSATEVDTATTVNLAQTMSSNLIGVGFSSGNLNGILGNLTFNGVLGSSATVIIHDENATQGQTYTVTRSSVTRAGIGTINYSLVARLYLNTSGAPGGGNTTTTNIQSTSVETHIHTGAGVNQINVTDNGSLASIFSPVFVNALAAGTNSLLVSAFANPQGGLEWVRDPDAFGFRRISIGGCAPINFKNVNLTFSLPDLPPLSANLISFTNPLGGDPVGLTTIVTGSKSDTVKFVLTAALPATSLVTIDDNKGLATAEMNQGNVQSSQLAFLAPTNVSVTGGAFDVVSSVAAANITVSAGSLAVSAYKTLGATSNVALTGGVTSLADGAVLNNTGNYTQASAATLSLDVVSPVIPLQTGGAGGLVSLDGILDLKSISGFSTSFSTSSGTIIPLIDNQGSSSIAGTFVGLLEGAPITVGGVSYIISYHGSCSGDAINNDVVLIVVTGPPASNIPVSNYFSVQTGIGQTADVNLVAHAGGGNGNPLIAAVVAQPAHGNVVVNLTTGRFDYTPNPLTYTGPDSFTYQVTDGTNVSNVSTVAVMVNPAKPIVVVTNTGGTYNGSAFSATYTIAGLIPGVDNTPGLNLENVTPTLTYFVGSAPTGTALSAAPTKAGTYTVVANFAGSANYPSTSASATFTITPASLTITGVSGTTKIYDGTTSGTIGGLATLQGAIAENDDLQLDTSLASATFADKNVGPGKTVTFIGFALSGLDAGNYVLSQPDSSTADITAASLTITGVSGTTKIYDGTTSGTIGGLATLQGAIAENDDLQLDTSLASATFADKNVGPGKTVTFIGFALSGLDAGNYVLSQPDSSTADITTANLTITASDVTMEFADGTTLDEADGFSAIGLQASDAIDSVTLATNATTTSGNWNVGSWTITPSAATGTAFSASNYNVTYVNGTLTVTSAAANVAPINTVPGSQGTAENTDLVFSNANNNAISIADVDAGVSSVQVTLTATNGTLTLSGTTGLSFSFFDANGTGDGDGVGNTTMTFRGTVSDINTALNGLTFTPTTTGAASVQIVTNDLGNTGTGGALTDDDTVNIDVEGGSGSGDSGGSIGNFIWNDANHNGIQDAGESGISGVTVNLLDGLGGWVDSFITDASGLYAFSGLAAGNYQIQVVLPTNYQYTAQHQGTDQALDSNINTLGYSGVFGLNLNQHRSDIDAGLIWGGSGC